MNLKRCLLACTLAIPAQGWCDALFINDATVHTMGPRTVLQDTDILVRDGRVHSLGIDLEPPIDAVVIEADGRPVTPGLFAGITAHGLVEISMVEDTADDAAEVILDKPAMRPEFDVTAAYNPGSGPIAVTRIEGLTWALLGAGQSSSLIGGQGQAVRFDGGWSSFAGEPVLYLSVGGAGSEQSGGSRAAKWMLLEQALAEAVPS